MKFIILIYKNKLLYFIIDFFINNLNKLKFHYKFFNKFYNE